MLKCVIDRTVVLLPRVAVASLPVTVVLPLFSCQGTQRNRLWPVPALSFGDSEVIQGFFSEKKRANPWFLNCWKKTFLGFADQTMFPVIRDDHCIMP